jgi:predicted RNase H-like nuclease
MYVGVDGCPDGWIAVAYSESGFESASFHGTVDDLWTAHRDADRILIDVPIGLRERSSEPRACDTAARTALAPDRHASVFPTPVRAAAREGSYEAAKAVQERLTDGSLNRQTWGIAPKIDDVDRFLLDTPAAQEVIRESHPEVCFRAFAGAPMTYSKTVKPRRAFWERAAVLRTVEPDVYDHLWDVASSDIDCGASDDDLLDAFAVALTARGNDAGLETLPATPETDPQGLPMEIVSRPLTD